MSKCNGATAPDLLALRCVAFCLQACAGAAPRGVYVCGNTSTSAGLTVWGPLGLLPSLSGGQLCNLNLRTFYLHAPE